MKPDELLRKIKKIGEPSELPHRERIKSIEKRADKICLGLIEDCSKLDYIHPKLENKDIQTGFKSSDYFPKQLKELKGRVFEIEESNEDYLAQKIKALFKP